ncbi:MAG: flagellar basal-body MS-ring/collar protein FliF [Clostridia bacterium]|nr:flagellar basal-body MS-ring/collar protein FliF [Clostridia bacterium]
MDFKGLLDKFKTFWKDMAPAKRRRLIIIGIVLILGLSILTALMSRTSYTVLYADLDIYEAGEIYNKLTEQGADVKIQNNGTILIDEKIADSTRMSLASEGYPRSGFSYDIFSNNVGISTSDSEKSKFMVFQLQDRLQNTIKTLQGVRGAIVTLSIPDEDMFVLKDEKQPVTASVVIDFYNSGQAVNNSQIDAIVNLMTGSVTGLQKERVSIIDTNMNVLYKHGEDGIEGTSDRYVLEKSLENDFEEQVLSMLEPIYGYSNVKVAASISLNFDKKSTENVIFTPVNDDEGIISTISEVKETLSQTENEGGEGEGDYNNDQTKTETSTSYQINQTIEILETAEGTIEDLFISVIVNSAELDEEVLNNIKEIAAYSVGVDSQYVMAQAMEFTETVDLQGAIDSLEPAQTGISQLLNEKFILGVIAIVFAFILLLIGIMTLKSSGGKGKKKKKGATIAEEFEEDFGEIQVDANPENVIKEEIVKFTDKRPQEVARLLKRWMEDE